MKTTPSEQQRVARGGPLRMRELLARVASHHLAFARYFHELACANVDPLSSFAALAQWRHASVAAKLEHYATRDDRRELDGWLQAQPDGRVLELLDTSPELDAPTAVILDYAFALEAAFERVFELLQAYAPAAGSREIVTSLARLEHGVALRLAAARQQFALTH